MSEDNTVVNNNVNPVVAVAKENAKQQPKEKEDVIITLDDGMRLKIVAVSSDLIQEVMDRYLDPDPTDYEWVNEDTGQKLINYDHPEYKKKLEEADRQRERAANDALKMFGMELLDPIPDNGWEKKLKFLGFEFDENDPFEREWAYKCGIASTAEVLVTITAKSKGLSADEVMKALSNFQDSTQRSADSSGVPETQG